MSKSEQLKHKEKFLVVELGELGSATNEHGLYTEEQLEAFLSTVVDFSRGYPKGKYTVVGTQLVLDQIKEALKKDKFKNLSFSFLSTASSQQRLQKDIESFLAVEDLILVGIDGTKNEFIMGDEQTPLPFFKTFIDEHGKEKTLYESNKKNNPIPSSTSARVLSATNSANSSTIKPKDVSSPVDLIAGLKNVVKEVQTPTFSYQLKFDDEAVRQATKDTIINIEVIDNTSKKSLGEFDLQKDKISSHNVTVEVAIAMMTAYMQAHPGADMEVKPKNVKAQQAFQEAAKVLKDSLSKIKYTIAGENGAEIVAPEVKVLESATAKVINSESKAAPSNASAKSLTDGNCLFNSFALGLSAIYKQQGELTISPELKGFFARNKHIFELSDVDLFQKQLAAILRGGVYSINLVNAEKNAVSMEHAILAAYEMYLKKDNNLDDDLFMSFGFIVEKFKEFSADTQLSDDAKEQSLKSWWQEDGYLQFLNEIKKDGVYVGDMEAITLARQFKINLNLTDLTSSQATPVSQLSAAELDISTLNTGEVLALQRRGVIYSENTKKSNLPMTLSKEDLSNLAGFLQAVESKKISGADIVACNDALIKIKYGSANPEDNRHFIIALQKIAPQLKTLAVENDKKPVMNLKHQGKHWDYAGGAANRTEHRLSAKL